MGNAAHFFHIPATGEGQALTFNKSAGNKDSEASAGAFMQILSALQGELSPKEKSIFADRQKFQLAAESSTLISISKELKESIQEFKLPQDSFVVDDDGNIFINEQALKQILAQMTPSPNQSGKGLQLYLISEENLKQFLRDPKSPSELDSAINSENTAKPSGRAQDIVTKEPRIDAPQSKAPQANISHSNKSNSNFSQPSGVIERVSEKSQSAQLNLQSAEQTGEATQLQPVIQLSRQESRQTLKAENNAEVEAKITQSGQPNRASNQPEVLFIDHSDNLKNNINRFHNPKVDGEAQEKSVIQAQFAQKSSKQKFIVLEDETEKHNTEAKPHHGSTFKQIFFPTTEPIDVSVENSRETQTKALTESHRESRIPAQLAEQAAHSAQRENFVIQLNASQLPKALQNQFNKPVLLMATKPLAEQLDKFEQQSHENERSIANSLKLRVQSIEGQSEDQKKINKNAELKLATPRAAETAERKALTGKNSQREQGESAFHERASDRFRQFESSKPQVEKPVNLMNTFDGVKTEKTPSLTENGLLVLRNLLQQAKGEEKNLQSQKLENLKYEEAKGEKSNKEIHQVLNTSSNKQFSQQNGDQQSHNHSQRLVHEQIKTQMSRNVLNGMNDKNPEAPNEPRLNKTPQPKIDPEAGQTQAKPINTGQGQASAGASSQPPSNAGEAQSASMPKQYAEQVEKVQQATSQQIANGVKGMFGSERSSITLQLKPEMLGRVFIQLNMQSGELTAHIRADQENTRVMMERSLHVLKSAFDEAGVKIDKVVVSKDTHDYKQQDHGKEQSQDRSKQYKDSQNKNDANPDSQQKSQQRGWFRWKDHLAAMNLYFG